MKVAIVYDRVNKWGGAERVILALNKIFPDAPLYTSLYSPKNASWAKIFPEVVPSFLNKVLFFRDKHEYLAPFMPLAFESLDLTGFDVVISVTSEYAKGVITGPDTLHICYCLTPTRYLWSHYEEYFKGGTLKGVVKPLVFYLRNWDRIAAHRPDVMLAVSKEVQIRIKKYYKLNSLLLYPPATLKPNIVRKKSNKKGEYYLLVSRLVPYKKVDLAISVFNDLELPLYIVGIGSEMDRLKKMSGPFIKFLGNLTDKKLVDYYECAKCLILPQYEDFGLVSVESQSVGTPVIAFKKGGALETVVEGKTGIFFESQSRESLEDALKRFQKTKFDKDAIIKSAQRFSFDNFKLEIEQIIRKNL